jgi:hypothetical protein
MNMLCYRGYEKTTMLEIVAPPQRCVAWTPAHFGEFGIDGCGRSADRSHDRKTN